MAPDASSRGVGRRRLGPLLGLHASRRVGDEATAKRPSTPGRCSAAGDKPAGLSWPWSSGGDRFSAASSRSSRARLGLVVGRVNSRTIGSPCPKCCTRLSSCRPMRSRLASTMTGPASRSTYCTTPSQYTHHRCPCSWGTIRSRCSTSYTAPSRIRCSTYVERDRCRVVPSGRREGMFPGCYSGIFGLGEQLGCVLNLAHSFDAIGAYL